jgi:hypothetical protein
MYYKNQMLYIVTELSDNLAYVSKKGNRRLHLHAAL